MERPMPPIDFNERKISQLQAKRTILMGEIAEIDLAIQRIKMKESPQLPVTCEGCSHCNRRQQINPSEITRLEAKLPIGGTLEFNKPPYEHLIQ
jgi:hypothetical protein